jgi:phosphohistidine phosphatase
MIELYVIRHAIAEERRPDVDDERRGLTDEGRAKFQKVVRGLNRLEVQLGVVLHSPWLRAVETTELLGDLALETRVCAGLAKAPTRDLLARIGAAGTSVGVVGHEPWLGELVAWLVCGDPRAGERFPLRKGGVVHLAGEARAGGMVLREAWAPATLLQIR